MDERKKEIKSTIKGCLIAFLIGVVLFALGIFMVSDDLVFWGMVEILGGGALIGFSVYFFFKEMKRLLTKKEKVISVVICVLVLMLGFAGYLMVNSYIHSLDLNVRLESFVQQPINQETSGEIVRYEAQIGKTQPFASLFVKHLDAFEQVKADNEKYISDCAAELTAKIDALETVTAIASQEDYNTISAGIAAIELNEATEFGKQVRKQVSNYEAFEQYREDFHNLVETYKVNCSSCGGSGRRKCSSCGGSGKKSVTFYSYGDWGEASYSSYECTSCNGRGRVDCGSCSGGYYYRFG